ncbi:hypothetical protein D3C79_997000 [compost metagenome]
MALGWVHIISCGIVYLLVGYGAQAILTTRPRAALRVSQLSGAAMIIIAALLFADRVIT